MFPDIMGLYKLIDSLSLWSAFWYRSGIERGYAAQYRYAVMAPTSL